MTETDLLDPLVVNRRTIFDAGYTAPDRPRRA
jgi:hypothetical protein